MKKFTLYILIMIISISCKKEKEVYYYTWAFTKYKYAGPQDTYNKNDVFEKDSFIIDTVSKVNNFIVSKIKNANLQAIYRIDSIRQVTEIGKYKLDSFKRKIYEHFIPIELIEYNYNDKIYKSTLYYSFENFKNKNRSIEFNFEIIQDFGVWKVVSNYTHNYRHEFYHDPEFYRLVKLEHKKNDYKTTILDLTKFPYDCDSCKKIDLESENIIKR